MKENMYRVIVHYEGNISFDIKAYNENEAEQIAELYIKDIDDIELVANLSELGVSDIKELF